MTTEKKMPGKIRRKRLTDDIIDQLVSMIRDGHLKTGDRLPAEPELMERFGVGRSSLREAIGALSLTGVLSVSPGRGTHVVATSHEFLARPLKWGLSAAWQDKIQEIIEARTALEQSIAAFAAERATDADIAALRAQHEQLHKDKMGGKKIINADFGFHKTLAAACHNSILERFFEELQLQIKSWMEQKAVVTGAYDHVFDEHAAILAAIERRSPADARAAVHEHLKHAGDHLIVSLKAKEVTEETPKKNKK
jgi:GntR family transcriptional repressor for pyruvate dehydrogenase complex